MLADVHYCGYCVHHRCEEDEYSFYEYCNLDKTATCVYVQPACDCFVPDYDYIKFIMGVDYADNS